MYIIRIIIVLTFISNVGLAQKDTNNLKRSFGVSLNTSISRYSYHFPTSLVLSFKVRNNQFELGPKFPLMRGKYYKRQMGLEFNYRYYPNGIKNRYSMFFLVNSDFYQKLLVREYQNASANPLYAGTVNQRATTNYYTLNLGYGIQVNLFKGMYLGSNIGVGILLEDYDDNRTSTNKNLNSRKGDFSKEFNFIGAISLGYRF